MTLSPGRQGTGHFAGRYQTRGEVQWLQARLASRIAANMPQASKLDSDKTDRPDDGERPSRQEVCQAPM